MDNNLFDYDENYIKMTKYEVLGKLPDPFVMNDGHRISSPLEWKKRREEIWKTAVELQYGTIPPAPEFFDYEIIYGANEFDLQKSVRITCGTKEKQTSFIMRIFRPEKVKNPPIVLEGDMCFPYVYTDEYKDVFLKRGIAVATFNRCELANDVSFRGRGHGPLYKIYPDYTFGALGAWAWGYMRCVDALERMGWFDLDFLAFTGHSRGGKTAMLAGVLDQRAKIINPNDTNAGSCSCYRIHSEGIQENGNIQRSETLKDLWHNFDFWLGPEMGKYTECEDKLPFDCHYLKALAAPRILLLGEAASDMWTNLPGTWQTSLAAQEVYKFLGCEDNFRWYFRKGYHRHAPEDCDMLANLICSLRGEEELYKDRYYRIPFKPYEKIFDWEAPEQK